jgi:peptidoglycan/LPS O-acetylase OafA/YrhL
LRASGGFALGGALALLANRAPGAGWLVNLYSLAVLLLISLRLPGLAIIPAALLIKALATPGLSMSHRVLSSRPAVWLGHLSYSIYLLHAPLLFVALQVLHHLHRLTALGLALFAAMYIFVLLALAAASFRMIENPARYGIQKMWNRLSAGQKARHVT